MRGIPVRLTETRRKAKDIVVAIGLKEPEKLARQIEQLSERAQHIIRERAIEGKQFKYIAARDFYCEQTVIRHWLLALDEYHDKFMA